MRVGCFFNDKNISFRSLFAYDFRCISKGKKCIDAAEQGGYP